MNEAELAKEFVKRWARLTVGLGTCQQTVMTELVPEPTARQQAQVMFDQFLGSSEERRKIALELAIVSFQVS
jgi:hypothetical protein